MRIPQRRAQQWKNVQANDVGYLTATAIERLKRDLERLEKEERPTAVEDVTRYGQLGDFSENAEYQEAKHRLRRIDSRIFSITQRLKQAVVILSPQQTDHAQLGSTVIVEHDGQQKIYHIVGPQETNPTQGRISHLSPLGSALMGHRIADVVTIQTADRKTIYTIIDVR